MKLLLVDDSTTMRRIQKNLLSGIGITDVIEAEHGQEAMEKLADNMPVDLVLLDWNMPVMDGFATLEAIRANPDYAGVKVVMCTSESEKTHVVKAIQAGASNYIIKPFTPELLKSKLGLGS